MSVGQPLTHDSDKEVTNELEKGSGEGQTRANLGEGAQSGFLPRTA
jgi:hypothetical protein